MAWSDYSPTDFTGPAIPTTWINGVTNNILALMGLGTPYTYRIAIPIMAENFLIGADVMNQVESATYKNRYGDIQFSKTVTVMISKEIRMPNAWDGGTFKVITGDTGLATGDCRYLISARKYASGDAWDQAMGTAVPLVISHASANVPIESAESGAITPAGTSGKLLNIQITRDYSNGADTMNGECDLMYCVILATATAGGE